MGGRQQPSSMARAEPLKARTRSCVGWNWCSRAQWRGLGLSRQNSKLLQYGSWMGSVAAARGRRENNAYGIKNCCADGRQEADANSIEICRTDGRQERMQIASKAAAPKADERIMHMASKAAAVNTARSSC